MTTTEQTVHSPIGRKRRAHRKGRRQVEVSVQCTCGRFQTPWRLDPVEAARAFAVHVGAPS